MKSILGIAPCVLFAAILGLSSHSVSAQQVTYPVTFTGSDPLATGYLMVVTEVQPVDLNSDGKADEVANPVELFRTPSLATLSGSAVLVPGKVYWLVGAYYNQFGTGPWGNSIRVDTRKPGGSPTFTIGAGTVANLSTRGRVGVGQNIMIAGLVIQEHKTAVLLRGIGPTLSNFNIVEVLQDPEILLINQQTGEQVAFNDDWVPSEQLTAASSDASAFALPLGSKDAAMLVVLEPGQYTVHCRGKDGGEGVALVEAYRLLL